ncbi:MAG: hypothetical protein AAF732_12855 [Pseudomonadota bacterium]
MSIRFALPAVAALAVLAPLTAAHAETVEDCLKATFDVAKVAQEKKPSDAQIKSLEASLMKIEELCDGKKFSDAAAARKDLEAMIAKL